MFDFDFVLGFPHNKMLNYPLATQLNLACLENRLHTPKSWSSLYFIENISIYCFDLAGMAAFLNFTRNAITKVRSGHTPMSDMLGNPMVHTRLWFCFYFIKKYINLLFHLAQIAAILDFITNAMYKVLSDYITMSGITKTLILRTKICYSYRSDSYHPLKPTVTTHWSCSYH